MQLPRERKNGEGVDWEFGISRCKLLYREWINSKVLLLRGNYIQYPAMNLNGKEHNKCLCYIGEICTTLNQWHFSKFKKRVLSTKPGFTRKSPFSTWFKMLI